MSKHLTSNEIKMRRNNSKKIIYVNDGNREEEISVSLNETVFDLKKKIEQKFHLGDDILKGKKIRKKGLKDRTFKDLEGDETTLACNHIHSESRIYFNVLKNKGGI